MSVAKTQLKRLSTGERVEAELHTRVSLEDLLDVEAQWTPERVAVVKHLLRLDVPDSRWPVKFYWNWALRAVQLRRRGIGKPLSPIRMMGVWAIGRWQGIVMVNAVGQVTRLAQSGRDMLYIEYMESTPWNLETPETGQNPELTGTGRQLLEAVVRLSCAVGFEGRVGLHALERAEGAYRHWGLTDLGHDREYLNLRYFEMSEAQATCFLRENS